MDPAVLSGLRLGTPRLELRLGTRADLIELAGVAEAGIHPPEEMPFFFAWTDDIGTPGWLERFVAFHEEKRSSWTPTAWELNLLVWAEGTLAGTQGMKANALGVTRTVETGSWLGAAFQGRGYGTEMRAAVLELAFRGLGAERAVSGWLEGNDASARVSAKLGYRETGLGEARPRGLPVVEHRVELARRRWQSPVRVEIAGLEACRDLFG